MEKFQLGFSPNGTRGESSKNKDELLKQYSNIVMNDFGNDDYYLSDDEREKKNEYYKLFSKILNSRKKFSKLSRFVVAYRNCLLCLDAVANDNNIMLPEDFKREVFSGNIEIYGLKFPIYSGKDRKRVNWEEVSHVILNDNIDPTVLDRIVVDEIDFNNTEEVDRLKRGIFTKDELEDIDDTDFDECIEIDSSDPKYDRKLIRELPELIYTLKHHRKVSDMIEMRSGSYNSFNYISDDDLEYIEGLDRNRGVTLNDIPDFKGNILTNDYHKYIVNLDDWESKNVRHSYLGRSMTIGEINEVQLYDLLESAGVNILANRRVKDRDKELKRNIKNEIKKEKALKKKLKKSEQNMKKYKNELGNKHNKKHKKKASDAITYNMTGGDYYDFGEYEDDMLNFDNF